MSNLQEAYEAIRAGDLVTAQAIAADVLKTNQQNAEAWFVLGEATTGERKIVFIKKAVKLDPTLQAAQDRLDELENPQPAPVLKITPADFDNFGSGQPDEETAEPTWGEEPEEPVLAWSEPQKAAVVPDKPAAVASSPAPVATKPAEKAPKSKPTAEAAPPTRIYNTLGIGVSLMLAIIMFVLFVQTLMAYFSG